MNNCRECFNIWLLIFISLMKIHIICAAYSSISYVGIDYNDLSSFSKPNKVKSKIVVSETELTSKKSSRKYFESAKIDDKEQKLYLLSTSDELSSESEEFTKLGYFTTEILSRALNDQFEKINIAQSKESTSNITPHKRKMKISENDEKSVGTILDPYGVEENGVSDASYIPVFLTEPESTYVVRNRPAVLKCKAIHALQLQFKCSGSSQPPPSNYEKHADPHTGVHLEEVTATITRDLVDEYFGRGPFKCECQAWYSKGVIKSQAAFINVSYIRKQFLTSPTSLRVNLGSKVTLHCVPPGGSPTPRIGWLKNNAMLDMDMKGITVSKGILTFQQVSLQDMANYTCTADNISGKRISETAVLIVYVNGGWSSWSSWIDCKCSENESQGKKRIRSCNNPVPLNGGQLCSGPHIEKSLECLSCTEIDWELYLGLCLILVACLILGAVLISCARRGIDNNISMTTTSPEFIHGIEKKSNNVNLASSKINYEYILEHNYTADKSISCGMPEPHYDVPNLSASYINPIDELNMHYLTDTDASPNSTSKSTYGIQNKFHGMSLSKKSVNKFNIESGVFHSTGGRLRLYDGEIMLYIPNLAISKNQKINVALMVLSEDTENISIPAENVMVCSAIVHCSPSDYNFLKPVILKVPHCLTNRDQWNVMIYHSENQCDDVNVAWRIITTVGQETINTPVFSQLDPSHAYLMTEQLGRYVIVADPKPGIPISDISIKMKLFAFIQMTPNTSILRIYVVRDFPYSIDTCSLVETKLGGSFLGESSSFQFHLNNGNLLIRLRPIESEAWVLPQIDEQQQVIPYAHIISNNSVLHCEFSLKKADQNIVIADLDVGFMQGNRDNIEKHMRFAISNRCSSHPYEATNTISTLDKRGNIVNDIVSSETSPLPLLTKRKICAALDPPRTDENDWRLLARKLNTDRYIAYFATKSSPTEQILNLLECRANKSSNIITELILTLKEMNRPDVVRIIEQNIEKQWI